MGWKIRPCEFRVSQNDVLWNAKKAKLLRQKFNQLSDWALIHENFAYVNFVENDVKKIIITRAKERFKPYCEAHGSISSNGPLRRAPEVALG